MWSAEGQSTGRGVARVGEAGRGTAWGRVKEGMGWGGRRCAGKAGRENRRGEGRGKNYQCGRGHE
jgi:hypothetical protein